MALLACAVAGCTDPPPGDPAPSATASSATPAVSDDAAPSPSAGDAEDATAQETGSEETEVASPSPSASSTVGSDATEATRSLDLEQRHPNGSVMRVTSLQFEATSMTLGIEVVNGSDTELRLASPLDDVSLVDDLGGIYEFIRPPDNTNLSVPARGTLTGELVYFGILNPEATALRLQTNDYLRSTDRTVYDPATESTSERSPHFSFEIPLAP